MGIFTGIFKRIFPPAAISLLLASCMTMNDYNYARIDSGLSEGKYDEVINELDAKKTEIYSSRDEVLVLLDAGILCHYAGEYEKSNGFLSQAEQLIEKYRATSITQSISGFLTNDTAKDYSGEDYEDIYSNIFMALNYIALGEYDEAMVEVRRFDNKIRTLKADYEKIVSNSDAEKKENNGVSIEKVNVQFADSALARYLSLLLYRNDGDYGNASVDLKFAREDFQTQKDLYDFAFPSSVDREVSVSRNDCHLNILALYGKSPVKKEKATRVYSAAGSVWYKLALPEMNRRKSEITGIKAQAVCLSNGKKYETKLDKIESVENIAVDTFQRNYSVILAHSLMRTITRAVSNTVMHEGSRVARKRGNDGAALLFTLFDLAGKAYTEAVERADVRCSRYFPASAAVSGITVEDEGEYEVTVSYMHSSSVLYQFKKNVTVKKGTLSLVESACLR